MQKVEVVESDEEELEWAQVTTSLEAADVIHTTIFEFAAVMYKLYKEDEALHPNKYKGKLVLPSAKVFIVTTLMKCWDNNRERLAEHYVNHVLNWKDKIDARDVSFFLDNNDIYVAFDGRRPKPEDIEFFKDLWRPNSTFALKPHEKDQVFSYFDIMAHYAEEWKKLTKYTAIWE